MKKRIKRNNYILFGAIAVAAVALSGVGFATWITGMQKLKDDDNQISITVDTAKNDTLYIDAAIDTNDSSIYLGEASTSKTGDSIYISDGRDPDLTFKFSQFRVIASDYYDPSTISVTMTVGFTAENKADYVTGSNGFASEGKTDTYIEFSTNFVDNGAVKLVDKTLESTDPLYGYTVKELNSNTITLSWGSAFGGKNTGGPATYYNNQLKDGTKSLDEKLQIMQTATSTLNAMNTALNNQTITLKFDVTAAARSSN